jgi:hypothetical protein
VDASSGVDSSGTAQWKCVCHHLSLSACVSLLSVCVCVCVSHVVAQGASLR